MAENKYEITVGRRKIDKEIFLFDYL